jgi:hypothetical protein
VEDLLLGLLEFLAELVLELAGEALLDLMLRGLLRLAGKLFEIENPVASGFVYMGLGAMAGWGSVILFPHPLVRPSRVHGISLLIAPLGTGLLMSAAGHALRSGGKRTIRIESFWLGFTFALGMALVRFIFAT